MSITDQIRGINIASCTPLGYEGDVLDILKTGKTEAAAKLIDTTFRPFIEKYNNFAHTVKAQREIQQLFLDGKSDLGTKDRVKSFVILLASAALVCIVVMVSLHFVPLNTLLMDTVFALLFPLLKLPVGLSLVTGLTLANKVSPHDFLVGGAVAVSSLLLLISLFNVHIDFHSSPEKLLKKLQEISQHRWTEDEQALYVQIKTEIESTTLPTLEARQAAEPRNQTTWNEKKNEIQAVLKSLNQAFSLQPA